MKKKFTFLFNYLNSSLNNWKIRHLLFFLVTIITIIFMGYHFGSFDQAIHIPFLKKISNPSLYPNDRFFDMRYIHYSFFWFIFIPFYRMGYLEMAMFLIYILNVYLIFWALWRLSKTLFKHNIVSLITLICFIFPHLGLSGFPLIEFSLLNRSFALPFILVAIDFYLKKKYYQTFFILGLAFNIHALTVNFALIMIGFDILFRIKKLGFKTLFNSGIVFFITAAPILIWKFKTGGSGLSINRDWFDLINNGMLSHIFSPFSFSLSVLIATLSGISTILLFNENVHYGIDKELDKIIKNFIFAGTIVVIIVFFSTNLGLFPLTIVVQSQIIRIGVFILLFSYLYSTNRIIKEYKINRDSFNFLFYFSFLCFSISPIFLLLSFWIGKYLNKRLLKIIIIFNFFIFVVMLSFGYYIKVWMPGIYLSYKKDDQTEVQLWIRKNTKIDSVLIVPPFTWWFYNNEWRVASERSIIVSLSDLLEVAFSPDHIQWWKPRFEAVSPGVYKKFNGNVFDNIQATKLSFHSLKKEDFIKIAQKYKASYLIIDKPYHYSFPIIFENKSYFVYQISN